MGMNTRNTAFWGINLTLAQALSIKEKLQPVCESGCGIYISTDSPYFEVNLLADNAPYGSDRYYNRDCEHVFGIQYAEGKETVNALKNVPADIQALYTKFGEPFLQTMGIDSTPEALLVIKTT